MRQRAFIKNENTSNEPWFIYIESEYSFTTFASRFDRRTSARRVATAMNKSFEVECRLLVHTYEEDA